MRSLVAPLVAALLLATTLAGAEVPIVPDSAVLRFTGFGASVASHDSEVVAVWSSAELHTVFVTRLDTSGAPIGNGHPLPLFWSAPAIGWAGGHFVVAGNEGTPAISAMAIDADGRTVLAPRVIVTNDWGTSIHITANGSSVLVTWTSQSLNTQTLSGVLLDANLNVLHEKFVIATRDIAQPSDHALSASVAPDGNDFLVAFESGTPSRTLTLKRVTSGGEVLDGATIESDRNILLPAVAEGVVVWWNGEQIVGKLGSGTPVVLAGAAGVAALDVDARDGKTAIVWSQILPRNCSSFGNDHAILARTFDGETAVLDPSAGEFALVDITIANGSPLSVWQRSDCLSGMATVRSSQAVISRSIGPSLQSNPDVATNGSAFLAVWIEQRDEEPLPRVYAAPLDDAGNPIGAPSALSQNLVPQNPRVAAGGGRFLAIWEDGSVRGRFLRADGTPDGDVFTIGAGANGRVVWDGARFVVAFSEAAGIRAAEVSLGGEVRQLGFTGEGNAQAVAELAAGPGEVMALIRTESPARETVRTVALRGDAWGEPSVIAGANRPCFSLACTDDYGVAIGWNGANYVALYVEHGGPGRGGALYARRIAPGGTPLDAQPSRILSLGNQYGVTGRLLWTGTEFLFVFHAAGIWTSSENLYKLRLSAGGTPLDSVAPQPPLVPGGFNTSVQGAFGAVLASPSRAVVVYSKGSLTAAGRRVFTTTTDFAALPKQRSTSRR